MTHRYTHQHIASNTDAAQQPCGYYAAWQSRMYQSTIDVHEVATADIVATANLGSYDAKSYIYVWRSSTLSEWS